MFKYIADINRYALKTGIKDITSFLSHSKFQLCWRYVVSLCKQSYSGIAYR